MLQSRPYLRFLKNKIGYSYRYKNLKKVVRKWLKLQTLCNP